MRFVYDYNSATDERPWLKGQPLLRARIYDSRCQWGLLIRKLCP